MNHDRAGNIYGSPAKAATNAQRAGGPPPIPGYGKKPSAPPPIGKGKDENAALKSRIADIRMRGDHHRTNGDHASAEGAYRKADEMETRMKLGKPQLSDKAMRDVKGGQGRIDNSGTKWGGY
jgi:hypothetical protein